MDFQDRGETDPELSQGQESEIQPGTGTNTLPAGQDVVTLPPGASLDDIVVEGRDLVIQLADGSRLVIPDGAVFVPQIVIDGVTVPPFNIAQLLTGNEPQPAAGTLQSSGGNFAEDEGAIQDAFDLGGLLPFTDFGFPQNPDDEIIPDLVNRDPDVVIRTPNNPAGAQNATASVDEAGLPARGNEPEGTNAPSPSENTTGTIVFSAPDGLASLTIEGVAVTSVGQTIPTQFGTLTITSVDLAAGTIGYSYSLADNTLGAGNAEVLTVVVTETDGDQATATLTIAITDDAPIAADDLGQVPAGSHALIIGDVLVNDVPGADGYAVEGAVLQFGNGESTVAPGTALQGQYGVLTLNADGTYSYARDGNTPGGVEESFTYTIVDQDGSTSTATLVVEIGDADDVFTGVPREGDGTVVNEGGLPARGDEPAGTGEISDADGTNDSDPSERTSSTVTFNSPDGVASLTINGFAINGVVLPPPIVVDGGTLVITNYTYNPLTGDGSFDYTFTLDDNTQGDTTFSFTLVLTDLDDDRAEDTLVIKVVDDVPSALDDNGAIAAGEYGPIGGNVVANDTPGADGATVTSYSGTGGSGTTGTPVQGTYGTLTITADGTYSYTRDPGTSGGVSDTFNYVITDGDGDEANANLIIAIADSPTALDLPDEGEGGTGVNEAGLNGPPAGSDAASNSEQTIGTFTYTAPDGPAVVTIDGIAVTAVGQLFSGDFGTLRIDSIADGSITYTYTLTTNTSGDATSDNFVVRVTDQDGDFSEGTLGVAIVDDVPTANPDTNSLTEDTVSVEGNILTDGSADVFGADGQGAPAITAIIGFGGAGTLGGSTSGEWGSLSLGTDGSYTYKLDVNKVQELDDGESEIDVFTYTIQDGDGNTSTTTLTISIFGANDAPVANADTNWTIEDAAAPITGDVLSNVSHPGAPSGSFADVADTDVDIETLTVTTTGDFNGDYGVLTLNSDGTYSYRLYTEAENATAYAAVQARDEGDPPLTDAFNYTASDGDLSASSTLTISIFGANDAPVANADTNWTIEDAAAPITGDVLSNVSHPGAPSGSFADVADTDVDIETLTVTTTGDFNGDYGVLTLNSDGTYSYRLYTEAENATAYAAVQARDEGDPPLTDAFNYTASDGDLSASSTLTISIFGANDAPVANADTNWTIEDAAAPITGDVLSNVSHPGAPSGSFADVADTDVDIETLTVTTTGDFNGDYGVLTLNSDGTYSYRLYTEAENATAYAAVQARDEGDPPLTDAFNYTASDGDLSASSTLTISIFGANDAPVANADTNWTIEDAAAPITGDVLSNVSHPGAPSGSFADVADTDVDIETLTVTTTGDFNGDYGVLTLNSDGTYSYRLYTEAENATAYAAVQARDEGDPPLTDAFNYTASDGDLSASSTLTISIFGANDAPVANADTNWTIEDAAAPITGDVLSNVSHPGAPSGSFADVADTDVDIETLTVTTTGDFNGDYGVLTLNSDGTYSYRLYTEAENATAYAAVQARDEGDPPLTDAFNYTASDGDLSASSTLTISIFGANDAPVANADTNWTIEDAAAPITGDVLSNVSHPGAPSGSFADVADTDVDIETLTVTTTGDFNGDYGVLTLNSDGTYSYRLYTEAENATAYAAVQARDEGDPPLTDAFNYTASDGDLSASSTLTISIFGANDAPVANADTNWTIEDAAAPITGDVLSNVSHPGAPSGSFADVADTDVDIETLTVTTTGDFNGDYGVLTLNSDGTYSYRLYTEAENATAYAAVQARDEGDPPLTDAFNYTASDGDGNTSTTTLTISIFGANDAPVANADTNWTIEDAAAPITGDVLSNVSHPGAPSGSFADVADTDVDIETLTVTTTGDFNGDYGVLTLNSDGTYSYRLYTEAENATAYAAVQARDEGDPPLTDAFNYTASDGDLSASSTLTISIFGANDAPVANADTNWTIEDAAAPITGDVLSNVSHPGAPSGSFADVADTDVDIETLTVTTTGDFNGDYGVLTLNSDGTYSYRLYTEAENATAYAAVQARDEGDPPLTDAFNYTASDGDLSASSTLTISIFGANDAPVANADTNWTIEDAAAPITGDVLSNVSHPGAPSGSFADVADTDVDIETLTVTTTGDFNGDYGVLTLNSDGTYSYRLYTEAENATAYAAVQARDEGDPPLTDAFNYTASDGDLSASSTLTISIFGANDAPVANADTNWTIEDAAAPITGDVLSNVSHPGAPSGSFADVADTDVDIETLTVTTTGDFNGDYGVLTLNSDGTYSYRLYTEAENATAYAAVQARDEGDPPLTDAFNYTASDGDLSASSTLTISIFGANDAPVANADTNWTIEDAAAPITGDVLSNVSHPGAPSGSFADVADTDVDIETLTVTTTGDFNGDYGVLTLNSDGTYSYRLYTEAENATAYAAVQARDEGDPPLTDAFNYTASDGDLSASSTLTISIFGANDAPVANADTNWTIEDAAAPITGDVLSNVSHPGAPSGSFADVADTDVDIETLTVTTTGDFNGDYGVLTLNSDGTYSYRLYTEAENATAYAAVQARDEGDPPLTDAFNYTASDGDLSASSTLTISIFGANDAPVANADTNWTIEDAAAPITGDVLSNVSHPGAPSGSFADVADTDVDIETLTVTTTGDFNGDYGVLTLNSDGTYSYRLYTEAENATAYAAVQARDEGDPPLTDAFNYTASDGDLSASSTLTISIFGANDAPVANADTNWTIEDAAAPITGDVLSNVSHPGAPSGSFADVADTDVDIETLTVTTTGDFNGDYGVLTLNSDGTYSYRLYTEAENATAYAAVQARDEGDPPLTDAFNYTASDGDLSASSTLTISIFGANDAPVANADTNWTIEDAAAPITGDVLSNVSHPGAPSGSFADVADTDVDIETLTVTTTGDFNGDYGVLTLNSDGTYSYRLYTEAENATAYAAVQARDEGDPPLTDAFNYTASDGDLSASSTLTISIFGANDAPVANADTNWTIEDAAAPITGDVLSNVSHPGAPSGSFADVADTDVDIETLTVTTTGDFNGDYGVLTLNSDGTYSYRLYTEAENATAYAAVQARDEGDPPLTDAFNYTASDGDLSASSTLTISIFGANDAPTIVADTATVSDEGFLGGNTDSVGVPSDNSNSTQFLTGDLQIGDVDTNDTLTVTLSAPAEPIKIVDGSTGTALQWAVIDAGKTLVGYVSDVLDPSIEVKVQDDGTYTVEIFDPIHHDDTTVEDIDTFVVPVSVSDGTASTPSTITVLLEDDSPEFTSKTSVTLDNSPTPTGTGDFVYSIGGDFVPGDVEVTLTNFSGQVGGLDISVNSIALNALLTTDADEVYNISFDYAPNPDAPGDLVTANGTVTFDTTAGEWTVTLDDPIQSYFSASIFDNTTISYLNSPANPHTGSSQFEVAVVDFQTGDFFVQFTSADKNLVVSNDGNNNGEFSGREGWLQLSSSDTGVSGNSIQPDEVIDFNFTATNPGNVKAAPSATASGFYIQLDQLNGSEDFVVVLKLADPSTPGTYITRALRVENTDVLTTTPPGSGLPNLSGNQGLIVINLDDYDHLVPAGYQLVGAQFLTSTEGETIRLYEFDGSITSASSDSTGIVYSGKNNTNDQDVVKIVDIGVVRLVENSEALTMTLNVTVADGDGDSFDQTLEVNPAPAMTATSTASSQSTQSFSTSTMLLGDPLTDPNATNDNGSGPGMGGLSSIQLQSALRIGTRMSEISAVAALSGAILVSEQIVSGPAPASSATDAPFGMMSVLPTGIGTKFSPEQSGLDSFDPSILLTLSVAGPETSDLANLLGAESGLSDGRWSIQSLQAEPDQFDLLSVIEPQGEAAPAMALPTSSGIDASMEALLMLDPAQDLASLDGLRTADAVDAVLSEIAVGAQLDQVLDLFEGQSPVSDYLVTHSGGPDVGILDHHFEAGTAIFDAAQLDTDQAEAAIAATAQA